MRLVVSPTSKDTHGRDIRRRSLDILGPLGAPLRFELGLIPHLYDPNVPVPMAHSARIWPHVDIGGPSSFLADEESFTGFKPEIAPYHGGAPRQATPTA